MLVGLFDRAITPEDAQEAILDIDARRLTKVHTGQCTPQMDKGQELLEVLELADEFTTAMGPPSSLPPLPIFKNIIDPHA